MSKPIRLVSHVFVAVSVLFAAAALHCAWTCVAHAMPRSAHCLFSLLIARPCDAVTFLLAGTVSMAAASGALLARLWRVSR